MADGITTPPRQSHPAWARPPHAVEPIIVLNAAFCERHLKNCPPTEELTRECNRTHELEAELDAAYKVLKLPDPCVNRAKECEWWATVGE